MRRSYFYALLLAAAVLVGGAAARLLASGASYVEEARAAETRDPYQAVLWYGEAMRAYVPGYHPHVTEAHDALARMAAQAENLGNLAGALDAWQEIHASASAVRSLYQPYPEWLEESEKEIVRLMLEMEAARKPPRPKAENEL